MMVLCVFCNTHHCQGIDVTSRLVIPGARWAPLYLSKSIRVNGNPKLVWMIRRLSNFIMVRVFPQWRKTIFCGVYAGERGPAHVR